MQWKYYWMSLALCYVVIMAMAWIRFSPFFVSPTFKVSTVANPLQTYCKPILAGRTHLRETWNPLLHSLLSNYSLSSSPLSSPMWPNFSPSRHDLSEPMTDLESFFPHFDQLENMSRTQRHALNLVLNPHLHHTVAKNAMPLLLRVFRRLDPLHQVLDSIVQLAAPTVLIVSIDGDSFVPVLQLIMDKVRGHILTRFFWHSFEDDCRDWDIHPCEDYQRLNAHFWSIHYLAMVQLGYRHVISIEDDLYLYPDFYHYHDHVRDYVSSSSHSPGLFQVLSISAYPTGPLHDCQVLPHKFDSTSSSSSLSNPGSMDKSESCRMEDHDQVFVDSHYTGWGSVLLWKTFETLFPLWPHFRAPYDIMINSFAQDGLVLHPCVPRVMYLPNQGTNGRGRSRWEYNFTRHFSHPLPTTFHWINLTAVLG